MPRKRIPSYRLHKPSGLAVVTLWGKDYYLGPYGSPESKAEYARLIGEYAANGNYPPADGTDVTVAELALRYLEHAEAYYRHPDGTVTSEVYLLKLALRFVREAYAHTLAKDFTPLALQAVRQRMIDAGWTRTSINKHVHRIRRMFGWAVAQGLLPVTTYQALKTVAGLRHGRSNAKEPEPVRPVPDEVIEATLPHLPPVVADMVRLQRLTGMRPGELCALRPCDLDTTGEVWVYAPRQHKTSWRGHQRIVPIGPRGQALLKPYLQGRPAEAVVFSPREAVAQQNEDRRAKRKTPLWPSHLRHQAKKRKKHPRRSPAEAYTVASYRRAIVRACQKAGVEPWHPHQLRHTAATVVRRIFGLEAAQVYLGHASADVTQVYAEKNRALAFDIAKRLG